ncbi:MAG: hypothetical protein ABIR26_12300, partial [Ramlibacter sp.]
MMKRFCGTLFFAAVLAGCAAVPADEPEKVLIDHGGPGGLKIERTGVLFGSIGFAPRDLTMSAMSVHLRPVDEKGHRYEIFATNRQQHAQWRTPDVDTEAQRIWAFSGRVPEGRYEIALVAMSGADARDIQWMNFKPTIPVTVKAGGAVYIGRWQYTPSGAPAMEPQIRIPGSDLVLRDMPEEDQLLLVRRDSPVGNRAIDDVLR